MHRSRRTSLVLFALLSLLGLFVFGASFGQGSNDSVTGGTHLVVSRASEPAPTVSTAPSLSEALVASWRWNLIALAHARGWAWSFAPAVAVRFARPFAVTRRAF